MRQKRAIEVRDLISATGLKELNYLLPSGTVGRQS
jgi:hypothetical protein